MPRCLLFCWLQSAMARINSEGGCRCCRSWTHGSVCVPVVVHHGTERCGGGRGRGAPRFIRDEFSSKGFQQSMFQHIFFLLDDCYFVVFHNLMRLLICVFNCRNWCWKRFARCLVWYCTWLYVVRRVFPSSINDARRTACVDCLDRLLGLMPSVKVVAASIICPN